MYKPARGFIHKEPDVKMTLEQEGIYAREVKSGIEWQWLRKRVRERESKNKSCNFFHFIFIAFIMRSPLLRLTGMTL